MKMSLKRGLLVSSVVFGAVFAASTPSLAEIRTAADVKTDILKMAESFKGQGDADRSRQNRLEPLVQELLRLEPQVSVRERTTSLVGAWKQVFGPYSFNRNRSADSFLDADHIYQVIFPGGYYYNVARNQALGVTITALFRGHYVVENNEYLKAQFNRISFIFGSPLNDSGYVELAIKSEQKKLANEYQIPKFLTANILASKGSLKEVYTDQDLRIMFGSTDNGVMKDYIYIMKRVK